MFLLPTANVPKTSLNSEAMKTNYTYVFCHGLRGWGSYDLQNTVMPYWGMFGGSLIKYLNARGFHCVAASVAPEGTPEADTAAHDMHIDNALTINENISTLENVYYFAYSCSSTILQENGTYLADKKITESLFTDSANEMGRLTGTTDGGFVIDETWLENDGLVNTVSARAPIGAPQKDFGANSVQPGVWNNMPVYRGDHMALQGGLLKTGNIREFYVHYFNYINSLG